MALALARATRTDRLAFRFARLAIEELDRRITDQIRARRLKVIDLDQNAFACVADESLVELTHRRCACRADQRGGSVDVGHGNIVGAGMI